MLSDSASCRALEFASRHGVPVESYLSTEMEDLLDTKVQSSQNHSSAAENVPSEPARPSSRNSSAAMDVTLQQVLDVCKYVYRAASIPRDERHAKAEFLDALRTVAKNTTNTQTGLKGVSITTVRDKCTTDRRLGVPGVHVDTLTFIGWLGSPELLRDHLCRRFPKFVAEIRA